MAGLKDLLKGFEKAMAAASFAEENEAGTACEFLSVPSKSSKKVLLGTDIIDIKPAILKYAIGLAKRMNSALEIFHLLPGKGRGEEVGGELNALKREFQDKNIVYQAVAGKRTLEEELCEVLKGRRDISCVVLGKMTTPKGQGASRLFKLGYPIILPDMVCENN